ncbi:MAG: adenylate/guanylate cyclase domain-containing protein [Pseudomonadota bacterium]
MSVDAIRDRLLANVGVGVAVVRTETLEVVFDNPAFGEWFPAPEGTEGATLADRLPELDIEAMRASVADWVPYRAEVGVKRKRRRLNIDITVWAAAAEEGRLLVIEAANITRIRELEAMIDSYAKMVERNTREIEREKDRAERLLLNIMPRDAYDEFKTYGVVTPQHYPEVSVVFLDFVGFTKFAADNDPTVTLGELNDIFTAFDRITEQFGCERIKTIGDAYLAVSGMPASNPDHARCIARCATRYLKYIERRNMSHQHQWRARVGLATGAAVGSVVGLQRYVYDVFGPAVNMASRLQTLAEPMQILAHGSMREDLVQEFMLKPAGTREIRGYGPEVLIEIAGATL